MSRTKQRKAMQARHARWERNADVKLRVFHSPPLPETYSGVPVPTTARDFCKPHRKDAIHTHARQLVTAYNRKSLAHFTGPLHIEALVHHQTTFEPGSAVEILGLTYRKSVILIPFRVILDEQTNSPTLACEVKGGWQFFEEWLSIFKAPPNRSLRKNATQIQQQWWDKNGKTFNIMGLPVELRRLIFEQATCVEHFPIPYTYTDDVLSYCGRGAELSGRDNPRRKAEKKVIGTPNISLLFANKQIYEEIKSHLQYAATKAFVSEFGLGSYIHPPESSNMAGLLKLRHITLDFDDEEYVRFFGCSSALGRVDLAEDGGAHLLEKLPSLKSIRIHFKSRLPHDHWNSGLLCL
ncbi:uncharacterized protein LTR77_008019 [Saxophila tyrrhenica]|uniref:Uncharacterized protein n=1 Tax=Saxophila tyrrhenica TaxID=1690608 RepID=A0AAV9P5B4_9PEZI|nr:hypothetical protein LTR77_008019 [Saxophila tyrrhenica]